MRNDNYMNNRQIIDRIWQIEWETPTLGWLDCPGKHLHTKHNGVCDCRITLDDGRPPTIFCVHNSCSDEIAAANAKLRKAIPSGDRTPLVKFRLKLDDDGLPAPIKDGWKQHIEACFEPDELVGLVYAEPDGGIKSKGITTKITGPSAHAAGTFIRVNPMQPNGSGNADVTAWRHVLIESDSCSLEQQWAAIKASNLPVSVVVHSGNKSLHAWVRVDAKDADEYRYRAQKAADAMTQLGVVVDAKCLNPSRLARLADCPRAGGKRQELLAVKIGAATWADWQKPEVPEPEADERPFIILGNMGRSFYYLKRKNGALIELTAAQHTRNALIELAPLDWWEREYQRSGDVLVHKATDDLIQKSTCINWTPERIRGRGAWIDDGRVVFHEGEMAFVDGVGMGLLDVRSKFVYGRAASLGLTQGAPLPNLESNQIRELLSCFQFEREIDSTMLSGWLVTATICGALNWRPHCWLTGAAGSGKTTILSEVVEPLLGNLAINIQGNTTEAGIRQALGQDARPVIFDEAEGEGKLGMERMEQVLALARSASRESGAVVLKGSAGGVAAAFRVRSSFLFSSIGVSIAKRADQGRITVVELLPEHLRTRDRFAEAKSIMAATVDKSEWCNRWRARCISLAQVISTNAEVFKIAIRPLLDTQRTADQLGALLAGAHSLTSTEMVTLADATRIVERHDWSFMAPDRGETDEQQLLNRLLESWVDCQTMDGREKITVAEAIRRCRHHQDSVAVWAHQALIRIGIRHHDDGVDIATTGTELRNRMQVARWLDQLRRLQGAEYVQNPIDFGGVRKRAVRLML